VRQPASIPRPLIVASLPPSALRGDGSRPSVAGGVTGDAEHIKARDCDDGPEDGHFRRGENTVERVSAPLTGGGVIYYTMRKSGGLPLEAISASGDSGGPVYIERSGTTYIAGTNSGSDDRNGCAYGSTDQ
jgi:hypothetical protein